MQSLTAQAVRLTEAAFDPAALDRAYADYIRVVLDWPLWSAEQPEGVRVPWRSALDASADPRLRDAFGSPGLYLFGSAAGIPLYLGMTRRPLKRRLWGRYLQGQRSQCQLAVDYEDQLRAIGLDGFPEELRGRYRRSFRGSTVRLEGAVAFAQHGIEGIWFTVLPMVDPKSVRPLERRLIAVADGWNRRRGYPPLLNRQDARSQRPRKQPLCH